LSFYIITNIWAKTLGWKQIISFFLEKDVLPFQTVEEFLDSDYTLAVEKETLTQYFYQNAREGTLEKWDSQNS